MSLYELNSLVRDALSASLPGEYWVEAEISDVREVRGHCYMELIQKEEHTNTPVARASAKCWKTTWMTVRPHFERITGQCLHAGMKVLIQVYAQFHENYGFSWIVTGIDPTFTIGDMARKRMEILRQLKAEGVLELNKELRIPMFAQRIAVISSAGAAGYGDFVNQMENNSLGFRFSIRLFPAVMQGERVEQSVIAALNDVYACRNDFDCVVIIRGGGAVSDLSGFDTLALAENVANFPLPVITGIGHERDESVLDIVANTRVKTPTAAAAMLIDNLAATYERIEEAREAVADSVRRRMEYEKMRLDKLSSSIPLLFSLVKARQDARVSRLYDRAANAVLRRIREGAHHIERLSQCLRPSVERILERERHRIDMLGQRAKAQDPYMLLKRGYSITLFHGRAVRDAAVLKPGDEIETRVENGTVVSIIKE